MTQSAITEQQQQLDSLLERMEQEGYSMKVQKNYDGSRDVHALLSARGQTLYTTLVPSAVVWADLSGEGTLGSKLPGGGEIDTKSAKFTLTIQCGGSELAELLPEGHEALAAAQTKQLLYFQKMVVEFWEWAWDHADGDDAILAEKEESLKQVRAVVAMTRKVKVTEVPLDDPDVQTMAKQNFVEGGSSPFGQSKTGETTLKATQKVFKGSGDRRQPPPVQDTEGNQWVDDGQPYVMRGMLVQPRIRFAAWAYAGRHGIRAELVRVAVIDEGSVGSTAKRPREDDVCTAFKRSRH